MASLGKVKVNAHSEPINGGVMSIRPMKQAIDSARRPRGGRWRRALRVAAVVAALGAGSLGLNVGAASTAAAAPEGIHVGPHPSLPYLVAFDVAVPDPHPSEDPNHYNDYSGGSAGAVGGSGGGGGGGISFTDVLIALAVIGGGVALYTLRSNRS